MQGNFNEQQEQKISAYPMNMPNPIATPWSLSEMPWKLASTSLENGSVMHFKAQQTNHTVPISIHQKRKSNLYDQACSPKQFISEERISAYFNGLHISNSCCETNRNSSNGSFGSNIAQENLLSESVPYNDYQIAAKELERRLLNATSITILPEAKKLHEKDKKQTLFSEFVLKRVPSPCTALIPWQPSPLLQLVKKENEKIECDISDMIEDVEDIEVEDCENNNTCNMDFNTYNKVYEMDEDL